METLRELVVSGLQRTDAREFGLVAGRLPSVNVAGKFEAVTRNAASAEQILEFLSAFGGSRHIDSLGEKPLQWKARMEGLGQVQIAAVQKNQLLQVRIMRIEPAASAPAATASAGRTDVAVKIVPERAAVREPVARQISAATPHPAEGAAPHAYASAPIELADTGSSSRIATRHGQSTADAPRAKDGPSGLPIVEVFDVEPDDGPTMMTAPGQQERPRERTLIVGVPAPAPAPHMPSPIAPPIRTTSPTLPQDESAAPIYVQRTLIGAAVIPMHRGKVDPTGRFTDIVRTARRGDSSDVHFVADTAVGVRTSGRLEKLEDVFTTADMEALVDALVPPTRRTSLTDFGAVDFAYTHPELGRFRCNVSRERKGLKVCLRLIGERIPTLASLGLPESVGRALQHHQGLVVVTGPSGHGKSSTLAALVDAINQERKVHVITVEDPIEYLHVPKAARLTQREVGTHTQSFQHALKASLRQDPDVIAVGELRDAETAKMAMAASETGHLVITTMNAKSAGKAIDRLVDMFPPSEQTQARMTLASSLRFIIAQRLLAPRQGAKRVVATELLPSSISLYTLIRDGKTFQLPSLMQRGKGQGIVRLDDSLAALVKAGKVELAEAKAFADSPAEVEAMSKGGAS